MLRDRRNSGEGFFCEACSQESIVKKRTKMDGWKNVGEEYVCALCGTALGDVEAEVDAENVAARGKERLASLADMLGEPVAPAGPVLEAEEGRFCRDCKHFLRHPFVSRCLLFDRGTEPMKDCEEFEHREATE